MKRVKFHLKSVCCIPRGLSLACHQGHGVWVSPQSKPSVCLAVGTAGNLWQGKDRHWRKVRLEDAPLCVRTQNCLLSCVWDNINKEIPCPEVMDGENMHFPFDLQVLLNLLYSLWPVFWGWHFFCVLFVWALLNAVLSRIGDEQCKTDLQTC